MGIPAQSNGEWRNLETFTGERRIAVAKEVFGKPRPHRWGCNYVCECKVDLSITFGSLGQIGCKPTGIYEADHALTMTFSDERKTHYGPSGLAEEEVAFRHPRACKKYRTEPYNSKETRDRGRTMRSLDTKTKGSLDERTARYFNLREFV